MALSIKTEEADRLARELAAATHESLTDAVTLALRERLDRVRRSQEAERGAYLGRVRQLRERARGSDRGPDADPLVWDDHGLPL